jgi:peptidyl-prolyl cis-trans isomerase A (cyclophilin A)
MQLAALVLTLAQAAPAVAPGGPAPSPAGPRVALDIVQGGAPLGTITIVLDEQKAPVTVANFLKYVRAKHYDGTVFHRVIPNFMIQGGNLTPELEERPNGPAIVNEAKNGLRNTRGAIAMARLSEPDSATDQFFIDLRDNYRLDYGISGAGYAVFGRVVDGMDVVDRVADTPTTSRGHYQNVPQVSVIIKQARELPTVAEPKPGPAEPVEPKTAVPGAPQTAEPAAPKP